MLPKEIEQLGNELASATDPAQKMRLQSNLLQTQAYLEELKDFQPALPTRTFDKTVSLVVGEREIQILLLGRGHTDGDVFIHLPKEKVVATGDALVDWMPYMNDGFPEDWVRTLDALEKYDFDQIIPGHGGVIPRAQLAFFRGYMADLVAAIKSAHADGASLDEMKKDAARQVGREIRARHVEARPRPLPRPHRPEHRSRLRKSSLPLPGPLPLGERGLRSISVS